MAYTAPASSFPQTLPQTEIEIESQPKFHIDPSSASSSTVAYPNNNSHHYYYQVFLNHRGSDAKKTFASHLYHRLVVHGFRVFFDKMEMQGGDRLTSQIQGAIRSASVHVAVFSPGYAESSWCLNELVQMLESGTTIIPVFYNVKPDDLRWTQEKDGVYAQALKKLENKKTFDSETGEEKPRYDSITIQNWRNALSLVAGRSGFDLHEACNGDEGELLDMVVQCVLKKLKRARFNVAEYPTGLDEKVKDIENTVSLQQQSGKLQVVGIVGFGGIGKTTLAQEVFNRKSSNYSTSYFLHDVRENAGKSSLHSLQSKLLKGLTQIESEIESVAEGTEILKEHLSSYRAFVILDDVDNVNQLDALLRPLQTALRSDSLILITSKDKDVLTSSRVEESSIYTVTGLNKHYSQQLFCMHAFSQSHPHPGFEYLVDKFLDACDGLPLSLKVFGALLYGKYDKSYWQDQFDILHRTLPSEIQQRLKMSYDSLNKEEREIFLDIACFFIEENKDMCIRIWDGCGWKGLLGFQNLLNKCLVELGSDNEIHMHDHLKELGREIAETSGSRLRLPCETDNIDNLLQQSSAITDLRGIVTRPNIKYNDHADFLDALLRSDMPWYRRRTHELLGKNVMKFRNTMYDTHHLGDGMKRLRLLDIEDFRLEHILRRVQLPNLIWLRWSKCPYSSLPSWTPMKNLRVLNVYGRELKKMWQDKLQAPLQLRELEICGPLSRLPKSIGQLKHLERFAVIGLMQSKEKDNLIKLPEEFCDLRSLKVLELPWSKLKSLPEYFGNLTNLEHVNFSCSKNLERLPNSFSKLNKLKHLDLSSCNNLTISSETFGNISGIEYINLLDCEKIEELPLQVAHQRSLEQLILIGTRLRAFPDEVGDLNDLEVLKLSSPFLKTLTDSLGQLRNLKKLTLYDCKQLRFLPESVGQLTQLTRFTVKDCPLLRCLPLSISRMTQLTRLKVIHCSYLWTLDGVCGLVKLQSLNISGSKELQGLLPIDTLVSLEELQASKCVKLERIQGLAQLTKLRRVDVSKCSELQALEGVEHVESLVRLDVSECPKLQWGLGVVEQMRQRLKADHMLVM